MPPRLKIGLTLALGAALTIGFVMLGNWQMRRLAWKTELIERVAARAHAPPVAAPGPAGWRRIDAAGYEYLRVEATGRYRRGRDALVQASTDRGAGWWVLSPLDVDPGFTLVVNRGFWPQDGRAPPLPPAGPVTVVGPLRLPEPGGGFLQRNDPARDRWFSRDVPAIARARGLGDVAPYFIDAEAGPARGPVAGLTERRFRNPHLAYALTWYALAALSVAGAWVALRRRGATA